MMSTVLQELVVQPHEANSNGETKLLQHTPRTAVCSTTINIVTSLTDMLANISGMVDHSSQVLSRQ